MKTFNGYEFEHSDLVQKYFGITSHDNVLLNCLDLESEHLTKCVLIKIWTKAI